MNALTILFDKQQGFHLNETFIAYSNNFFRILKIMLFDE